MDKYTTICATGHRPDKLYGYNLSDPRWTALQEQFKLKLVEYNCKRAISGMALGVDQVFALAVLELKESGYDISLTCAVPCKNHSGKWPRQSQLLYDSIKNRADEVVVVTDLYYHPSLMQTRNEWMVNRSDYVFAVWDGTSGGTKNCVAYAEENHKPIVHFLEGHL